MDLKDIRAEYLQKELNESDMAQNPIEQLNQWFDLALKSEITYPNAASLASVDNNGAPHSRIILIKDIKDKGVTFFTDYSSDKGKQLENNKNVCINIFWKEFDRQVRMNGTISKVSREESVKYFQSRPKDSQISATASSQSAKVSKEDLVKEVEKLNNQYANEAILPCPETWGGYFVKVNEFEFWQGRPNRLHDRFKYTHPDNWQIHRVSP
jgi:pyridoxamine 5'-phosphate oxidase